MFHFSLLRYKYILINDKKPKTNGQKVRKIWSLVYWFLIGFSFVAGRKFEWSKKLFSFQKMVLSRNNEDIAESEVKPVEPIMVVREHVVRIVKKKDKFYWSTGFALINGPFEWTENFAKGWRSIFFYKRTLDMGKKWGCLRLRIALILVHCDRIHIA